MTEPGFGSDRLHMHTRAERRGNHYLLKGTKQYDPAEYEAAVNKMSVNIENTYVESAKTG